MAGGNGQGNRPCSHLSMFTFVNVYACLSLHLLLLTLVHVYICPWLKLTMYTDAYVYTCLCLHLGMFALILALVYFLTCLASQNWCLVDHQFI